MLPKYNQWGENYLHEREGDFQRPLEIDCHLWDGTEQIARIDFVFFNFSLIHKCLM